MSEKRILEITEEDFYYWFYERMFPRKDHPAPKWDELKPVGEHLPVAPEPHVNERILEWGGLRNCKRNRKNGCAICQDCPFRIEIEQSEAPAPGPGASDSNGGGA